MNTTSCSGRVALLFSVCWASVNLAFGARDVPNKKELAQGYWDDGVAVARPHPDRKPNLADKKLREQVPNLELLAEYPLLNYLQIIRDKDSDDAGNLIKALEATSQYEYVGRNYLRRLFSGADDLFDRQWALNNTGQDGGQKGKDIRALAAWEIQPDARNIAVAIIDSGLNFNHPDILDLWCDASGRHGINAVQSRGSAEYYNPSEEIGHGTRVAGVIGARGGNGFGISGVARMTKLMPLKFTRGADWGGAIEVTACINYAIDNGVKVINASFGFPGKDAGEESAIARARERNIVFVAAAGNDRGPIERLDIYPAMYDLDNIVTVAATDNKDHLIGGNGGSNFSAGVVDLAAPGDNIVSTDYAGSYSPDSGTSMAAPHVSGALALMAARFEKDTPRQLINRMLRTVDKDPALKGKVQSGGRLNLWAALKTRRDGEQDVDRDRRPFNDDLKERAALVDDQPVPNGWKVHIRSSNTGATPESFEAKDPELSKLSGTLWWSWRSVTGCRLRLTAKTKEFAPLIGIYRDAVTPETIVAHPARTVNFEAEAKVEYIIVMGSGDGRAGQVAIDLLAEVR